MVEIWHTHTHTHTQTHAVQTQESADTQQQSRVASHYWTRGNKAQNEEKRSRSGVFWVMTVGLETLFHFQASLWKRTVLRDAADEFRGVCRDLYGAITRKNRQKHPFIRGLQRTSVVFSAASIFFFFKHPWLLAHISTLLRSRRHECVEGGGGGVQGGLITQCIPIVKL